MLRFITILFFTAFSAIGASAEVDTSGFIHFSLRNGFPSNNVYSVLQDKNGYLWFATDNGVVKYNGYSFDIYNTDRGLPANDVWELYDDNAGRIWLKSFSYEIGYIKNRKYKKINYKARDRIIGGTAFSSFGNLVCFVEGSDGKFHVCFANDELLTVFPFKLDFKILSDTAKLAHIILTSNMGIDFYNTDHNVYRMKPGPDTGFKFICTLPEPFRSIYVSKPGFSPKNEMWSFKMNGSKVDVMNLNNCTNDSIALNSLGADASERVYAFNPYHMNGSRYHTSSLITNSHLYTLDEHMKLVSRKENIKVLPSNFQLAYKFEDLNRNAWYTTKGDGAWCEPHGYNLFDPKNRSVQFQYSRFVGAINNKLFWWDSKKFELTGFIQNEITDKIEFHEGTTLFSVAGNDSLIYISSSGGTYEYDQKRKKLQLLSDKYRLRSFVFFHEDGTNEESAKAALRQIRKLQLIGNDLYGIFIHGIMRCEFKGNEIIIQRLGTERFNDFFYDKPADLMYCYSNRRVLLKNVTTGKELLLKEGFWDSLSIHNIRQIEKDRFGNLFVEDDNGIFLCDDGFNKATKLNFSFSLSDGFIQLKNDRLYIAGKFGVAYMNILGKGKLGNSFILPNYKMHYFRRPEGFVVSNDEYAYLKTDEGLFNFKTDTLIKYASDITEQNDFFRLILLAPFEKEILDNDTFRMDQSEEKINLDFINYYGNGQKRYIFRKPGQKEWEESFSGEIFIGSFSPDEYCLIECRLKDDIWESKTFSFYVYRRPYWWQTTSWKTVFWVSGSILFIGLILIIVLVTRHFVAKKNERKRAMTELELRAIHSQINPHFIFNTLSASLFFISKKRFDDAYEHVNKFSRLLRAYLKSSQDRYVTLQEEISMLRNYIELQQVRFEQKFEYSIEVDNKLPLSNIRIPSLLLQPLVENAINHGLFHKGEGGYLLLKFIQGADSTELICIIDDNGVGRETAKKINERSATRESYGTKLTNQLLEVFKQYEHFDIKLEYTDKIEPETGTIVTLVLKNIKYVA